MKKLDESVLKRGDIILTTATSKVSKAVRAATQSDISHAMVYVESHSVVDATGEGVQARNTQRLWFDDGNAVHVLRRRDGLSTEEVDQICTYARRQVGTQYTTKEAVRSALGGARSWTKKQFCSRLVAQAYHEAGIDLVADPNYCSPADLKESSALIEVLDAIIPVSPEEVAAFKNLEDTTEIMRRATNAVLDGARVKNKEIQNFDDLNQHVAQHPEDDDYILGLLKSSGYLEVWQVETRKNAWQYDLELMNDLPPGQIEGYCWSVLENEEGGPNRYVMNRAGYAQLARLYDRRTFKAFLDLYDRLSALHSARVETATRWLISRGLVEAVTRPLLRPHSPEWFEALQGWDPPQAMITRRVIELAGDPQVCSICGDSPAHDYRLPEGHRAPSGVDTLRLCDDCLAIRRGMGEPYEGPV